MNIDNSHIDRCGALVDKLIAWQRTRSIKLASDICEDLVNDADLRWRFDEDGLLEESLTVWINTRSIRLASDICEFLSTYYPQRGINRDNLRIAILNYNEYLDREAKTTYRDLSGGLAYV